MTANIGAGEFEESTGGFVLFGQTLSSRTLGIALGVIGIAVAGYSFVSFVQPLWTTLDTLNSGIQTKQQSIVAKDAEVKSKASLPQKFEAAKEKTNTVISLFPSNDSIDVLLIDLNKLAEPNKVVFTSYVPGAPTAIIPAGQYRSISIPITIEAPFADAVEIIQNIESLQASLAVRDLKLAKKERVATPEQKKLNLANLPPLVTTSFNLVAYIPVAEDELKSIEASAAAAAAKAPKK
jgi:type IV pilus assembly protein PilO